MSRAISYQLLIELTGALRVRIGRLGTFDFPAGRYLYTGSARRNLEARLTRHLRREKRLHWHIDYLLAEDPVRILAIRRSALPECTLHRQSPGEIVVPGFGASDCRAGCGSHLKFLAEPSRERRVATPVDERA